MRKIFFKFILFTLLLSSCTVRPLDIPQSKITELSMLLSKLNNSNYFYESETLSTNIFTKTKSLTQDFKLTSPPQWHNFLVNIGLKEKGLCFHWSDALYGYLKEQGYEHFGFHLAGANIGEYFDEHNALVISTKNGKFRDGVVIDPWRKSGVLYFSRVLEDKKYKWQHRKTRGCK